MIRSKTAMGILWAWIALVLHVLPGAVGPVRAQSSRKDDIVFNSRGVPLAGASVRVCTMPAAGQPCTPLALIYSDSALTQALANPTTTDGLGNYFFYALPGKYEIELSGPGITTKQLPNVILPNDPNAPTFGSVSSSGGISAFSLNLTGNLTVNGNTTVVGNLASGTLNLTNQVTPPGAAGAGTVNVYTKTSDKRLYYKDDTGTEVGPIANTTGVQTNVTNTFTAAQNFDGDVHNKGPNPVYDVTRYGGYLNVSPPSTTGGITSGQTALTVAAAQDFANGNGILILGAGPATALATPTGVVVTPQGVSGSTTYNYCVVAEDYAGGRTACSAGGSTATGAASLAVINATITSCSRTAGIVTCTTSANHHFQAGFQVNNLAGTLGDSSFEGAFTIASVPTSTTYTFFQYGASDVSGTVSTGTAQVASKNFLQWNTIGYTVLRSYVYRCTTTCALPANAANYSLAGVAQGMDGSFVDMGYALTAANVGNGDVAATAPTAAAARWLSTTIVSGGGTTSLVLANAAGSTVAGAKVLHDNTPNILAACSIQGSGNGGIILIPHSAAPSAFPVNSTLNLSGCVGRTRLTVGTTISANASIIPGSSAALVAMGGGTNAQAPAFYSFGDLSLVAGNAYPVVYFLPGTSVNNYLAGLHFQCGGAYQSCIYQDEDTGGNNVTSLHFSDVHCQQASGQGTCYVSKGGFGFFWDRGGWSTNATSFASPPAMLWTANCGLGNTAQQTTGIFYADKTYAFGGILVDTCGIAPIGSGPGHAEFRELQGESLYGPLFRSVTGSNPLFGIDFLWPAYSDFLGGAATPVFDFTGTAGVSGLRIEHPNCGNGNQPLIAGGSTTAIEIINGFDGCGILGTLNYIARQTVDNTNSADIYSNVSLGAALGGHLFYQMAAPAAPQSAVVSAGGSVPVGVWKYQFSAVDYDGRETFVGAFSSAATTSSGNQTITVTLPASFPAGAAGLNLYRSVNGGPAILVNAAACSFPQFTTPGAVYVDTFGFACGNSTPSFNTAGVATLSSNGLAAAKLRVGGESLTASPRGEQNMFLPGALTSTWTAATWTIDKGVTVTRVQVQAKTAPVGCTTSAIVRLTDGTTPVNVTISAAANDSGVISQNYAAGAAVTVSVQTAAAGCGTSPADANITVQYRMQ